MGVSIRTSLANPYVGPVKTAVAVPTGHYNRQPCANTFLTQATPRNDSEMPPTAACAAAATHTATAPLAPAYAPSPSLPGLMLSQRSERGGCLGRKFLSALPTEGYARIPPLGGLRPVVTGWLADQMGMLMPS